MGGRNTPSAQTAVELFRVVVTSQSPVRVAPQSQQIAAGLERIGKAQIVAQTLLTDAKDRKSDDYLPRHQRVLEHLPQILHCIRLLMRRGGEGERGITDSIVMDAANYYQYNALQAEPLLKELTEHYRALDNKQFLALVSKYRGDLLYLQDDTDGALRCYDEAEKLFRDVRDDLGLANTLQSRGHLLRLRGDTDGASQCYDDAEKLFRDVRDNLGLANTLKSRGHLLKADGHVDDAYALYRDAEALYRAVRDPTMLALTLAELYECCVLLDRLPEAEERKAQALAALDDVPYDNVKAYVLIKLGIIPKDY